MCLQKFRAKSGHTGFQGLLQPRAACGWGEREIPAGPGQFCCPMVSAILAPSAAYILQKSGCGGTKLARLLAVLSLCPSLVLLWRCTLSEVPHLKSYDWPMSSTKKGPVKSLRRSCFLFSLSYGALHVEEGPVGALLTRTYIIFSHFTIPAPCEVHTVII